MLICPMLTEPGTTAEIHSALPAPWQRTVTMTIRIYVLLPAVERHIVLTTIIAGAGDDVDGASRGIVDGEIRGGLAVNVDGAGVV